MTSVIIATAKNPTGTADKKALVLAALVTFEDAAVAEALRVAGTIDPDDAAGGLPPAAAETPAVARLATAAISIGMDIGAPLVAPRLISPLSSIDSGFAAMNDRMYLDHMYVS
jgi:hypothetical protein